MAKIPWDDPEFRKRLQAAFKTSERGELTEEEAAAAFSEKGWTRFKPEEMVGALGEYTASVKKAAGATADFQKQIIKWGAIQQTITGLMNAFAGGLRDYTTIIQRSILAKRGELSASLALQHAQTPGAQFIRGIPLVGGALAGVTEALHARNQQLYGTEFMARAAAVFEKSIPKMDAAIDSLATTIASGKIRLGYAFAPEEAAYQQRMLAIRTSPAGVALQTLLGQRKVAHAELHRREKEVWTWQKAIREAAVIAPEKEAQYRERLTVAQERLRQSSEATAKMYAPAVMKAEKELRAGLETLRAQAGREYQLQYYRGFKPTAGLSWTSFGQAAVISRGVPPIDQAVAEVELTAAIKELTAALEGINPTGKQGK